MYTNIFLAYQKLFPVGDKMHRVSRHLSLKFTQDMYNVKVAGKAIICIYFVSLLFMCANL